MSESTAATTDRTVEPARWAVMTVAIGFGLLYAYDLWEAISPLVVLPAYYDLVGLNPSAVPWWVLILGVAIPPVSYATSFALARGRKLALQALIFTVGLSVVAGMSLGVIALEQVLRPEIITIN